MLSKNYRLDLGAFVDHSLQLLEGKITRPVAEVREAVLDFFKGRLEITWSLKVTPLMWSKQ